MENTKKAILSLCLLIASILIVSMPVSVQADLPVITHVQGNGAIGDGHGTATNTPLSVTLANTPAKGNVLIAVIGLKWSATITPVISTPSQDGVTWSWVQTSQNTNSKVMIQIYVGVVESTSASASISIPITNAFTVATADVCEYSGVNTVYAVDQANPTKGNSGFPSITGTSETIYTNELLVGATLVNSNNAQTAASNGFTLIDGASISGMSIAYLEKIVTSTTVPSSSTTGASGSWAGIVISLRADPSITLNPPSCMISGLPCTVTMTGTGFAVDSDITATLDSLDLTLTGTAHTDTNGDFSVTFIAPSGTALGGHDVVATDTFYASASAVFMVTPFVTPETPFGVFASLAAVCAAFAVFMAVKRHKKPFAPSLSI